MLSHDRQRTEGTQQIEEAEKSRLMLLLIQKAQCIFQENSAFDD